MKKFYITTPIYYVNSKPHIGHAYTTIVADILARYYRRHLGDKNVFFLTGTDEHGAKIAQAAEQANVAPQIFCDQISKQFKDAWKALNIANDDFIRTTEPRHEKVVKEILLELKNAKTPKGNPAIFEGEYSGLYCVGCESYKKEEDLVDGKCPDHNKAPEFVKEKNWYFKLSDFADILREKISNDEIKILPADRKAEVLSFINQGLEDIAISRRQVKWGVALPFDEEQTTYVWVDALINYISALDYPKGKNFKNFWPANVQLLAKDILKFHCIIWPALLIALGIEPPQSLFVHGYFTIDGKKMSKTLGNVIDPNDLVSQFGADAARYLIISQFQFGQDGDIKAEEFKTKFNADLANGIGNFVSRVLGMTEKYFENKIPKGKVAPIIDWADVKQECAANFQELKIWENAKLIFDVIKKLDGFIATAKPWEVAKTDENELKTIIYNLLESIRELAVLLIPFLPETSAKIFAKINIDEDSADKPLKAGAMTNKGAALFERLI
jgi:methionyl-tRNA synthetase